MTTTGRFRVLAAAVLLQQIMPVAGLCEAPSKGARLLFVSNGQPTNVVGPGRSPDVLDLRSQHGGRDERLTALHVPGVGDVWVESTSRSAAIRCHRSTGTVRLYVGAAIGTDLGVIASAQDGELVDRRELLSPRNPRRHSGLIGSAGVQVPLGSGLAVFAEGRTGAEFQLGEVTRFSASSEGRDRQGVSGFGGLVGFHVQF